MFTQAAFLQYAQWLGIAAIVFAAITVLGFILKWGFRFRLVGVTSFTVVLAAGCFALNLGLYTRAQIPGAVRYSLVYDNGGAQTVIAVSPQINATELEATLRQAASDLFSYGRSGRNQNQMLIRARTILHPEPGVSQILYLGEVKRSLSNREDAQMAITINQGNLAKLSG